MRRYDWGVHPAPGRARASSGPGIPGLSEGVSRLTPVALILHRGDEPASLATQLGALLAADPLDVFERELVITPAAGVERWLSQRLAHHLGAARGDDGVCAGLDVRTPHSFMSLMLGREFDDPWHPDRLAWPTLRAVDESVSRPGFEALAHHLGADAPLPHEDAWSHTARQSRRYAVARRLAGLFARYCDDRPALVRAWETGSDEGVDPDLAWQPRLWRSVLDVAATSGITESPVARLDRVVAALRAGTFDTALPRRVSFFGYTRMPEALLDLLDALSTLRDVHLWLPHPSGHLWHAIEQRDDSPVLRSDDDSATSAHHPLLATLGRDVRELQETLRAREIVDATPSDGSAAPPTDDSPAPTRLGLLQADVRGNRAPSTVGDFTHDTSVQVHACHGAARQVDALREILVWLLDENHGNLQPRDIVVMCPDVEAFAPLVKAAFAATDDTGHHPGARLRVQLADRGTAATNPLAEAALRLIHLVTGRVTASQVLDFAGLPGVRERFGFDAESLDRIAGWVRTTGARWGLDATHRGEYQLEGLAANTWSLALDRLALGVAMSMDTDAPAAQYLPVDDLGSTDIETAGAFVALMTQVSEAAREIRSTSSVDPNLPRATLTPGEWFAWLRRHVPAVCAPAPDTSWQSTQFEREIAFLEAGAGEAGGLRVTDVRLMLEQRWGPRPTRTNFRNGAISVCTLTPMRSVPHKAVVLLGLDDETYPRAHVVDGDDALARHPRVGERDPRSEDRQLLLDALMAADEYFIALYSGFDERDGTRRPPAVPLQELIAAAAATGQSGPGESADAARADDNPQRPFEYAHPLQPFDERNFLPGGPLPGGSYDAAALDGAQALRDKRRRDAAAATASPAGAAPTSLPRMRPLVTTPLPPVEPGDLTLDDLVRFMENPAREFLRERLQVGVRYEADEVDDAIPIAPDNLQLWAVGDRMLRRALGDTPLERVSADEARSGMLPPDAAGFDGRNLVGQVEKVLAGVPDGERVAYDVSLTLELPGVDGAPRPVLLTGVVSPVIGDEIEVVNYGSVQAKHLARGWVSVLALAAARPERPWRAAVRGKYNASELRAPEPGEALRHLSEIAVNRHHGLRAPLPVPAKTSLAFVKAYLQRRRRGTSTEQDATEAGVHKARQAWESEYDRRGEGADPWWGRLYPPGPPRLETLNTAGLFVPRSLQLWTPLVDHKKELAR